MYFTYIIQSHTDYSYYIGYTGNLLNRLDYHNSGRSRYTRKKTPWKLVYMEEFQTKSEAIKREIFLKRQKSKTYLEQLIDEDVLNKT